jgi:hypothetical protein
MNKERDALLITDFTIQRINDLTNQPLIMIAEFFGFCKDNGTGGNHMPELRA